MIYPPLMVNKNFVMVFVFRLKILPPIAWMSQHDILANRTHLPFSHNETNQNIVNKMLIPFA